MMEKRLVEFAAVMAVLAAGQAVAVTEVSTTVECPLSIRYDAVRSSAGDEMLRYSNLWVTNGTTTVAIAENGTNLWTGLADEGAKAWSAARNGTYVLTHTTFTNGVSAGVETATFVVTGKDIPFPTAQVAVTDYGGRYDGVGHTIGVTLDAGIADPTVRYSLAEVGPYGMPRLFTNACAATRVWCEITAPGYITQTNSAIVSVLPRAVTLTSGSASKPYDGTALTSHTCQVSGDGFVADEGVMFAYSGAQTAVGSSPNAFTYELKDGTLAENYTVATATGTLEVTKAGVGVGPNGDGEPGDGEIPVGGLSWFDATAMYDGEGHTINTQALFAVTLPGADPSFSFSWSSDGVYRATPPAYTNVGEYVCWYRIAAPNYIPFAHSAKVTITPSASTVWFVDDERGDDANSGSSWAYAKKTIQGAIDVAISGNRIVVTNGTYGAIVSEDAAKSLFVSSVNGPDVTVIDGGERRRCVLSGRETAPHKSLRVSGFTICDGRASTGAGALGGAFTNCLFKGNCASSAGGATWESDLVDCSVVSNRASDSSSCGGGMSGGSATATLIEGNVSAYQGGGAYKAALTNCVVMGNQGPEGCAVDACTVSRCVISNHHAYTTIRDSSLYDSLITGNESGGNGSYVFYQGSAERCTVVGNIAGSGALSWRGTMTDSIVYGNDVPWGLTSRWTTFENCCTADPSFADSAQGDYRLTKDSQCIDAGGACPATLDLDGRRRVVNGKVDLGAYEFPDEIVNVVFELGEFGIYMGGGALTQRVVKVDSPVPPLVAARAGWEFASWDRDLARIEEDTVIRAQWTRLVPVPAAVITSAAAQPRYPWNGMVDVDLTFTGAEMDYRVSLVAKDIVGGTNLPVRTVLDGRGDTLDDHALRPGTYRLTWDAAKDMMEDVDFEKVSIEVNVEEVE